MTLVVGLAAHTYVQQVGDRKRAKGKREHDPQSNKCVVMLGTDGYICVSYSGLAYIRDRNTDQVLAELMAQTTAMPGIQQGSYASRMGGQNASRVGLAISRLERYLDSDFPRIVGRKGGQQLQILITGFLGKPNPYGRHVRPYVGRFSHKPSKNSHPKLRESPRAFTKEKRTFRAQIGQIQAPAVEDLHQYLDNRVAKNSSHTLTAMREAIEVASHTNPSVGPDCLGVTMSRWGHVIISYMPEPSTDSGQSCYTPWLISRSGFIPPQTITGKEPGFVLNGFSVGIERIPALRPSDTYTSGGQVRKGP